MRQFLLRTIRTAFTLGSLLTLLAAALAPHAYAQVSFEILPAEPVVLPFVVDSNSPVFWRDDHLFLFSSGGEPMINTLNAQFEHMRTEPVGLSRQDHLPMWIESIWQSRNGTIYGWYHHERIGVCPNSSLTVPEIGAVVSYDNGKTFIDLGIILSSGERTNCFAQNGFFASGHGDFSVILDRERRYFYFLFGAYGGDVSQQGVAIARMPFANLLNPVGAVWKYHQGEWSEPGIAGSATTIFPASVSWGEAGTDSFWGPSIHWNTYLRRFVVLMNRSCCSPGWPQEGIYMTMNADLADPSGRTEPKKILSYDEWYPFVMGLGAGETSSEAGQRVRLFARHHSEWELVFHLEPDSVQTSDEEPAADENAGREPRKRFRRIPRKRVPVTGPGR
jgi:hypothetical protein